MPVGSFPGVNTHPASVGDTLTLYAIGLGQTNPAVGTGAAATGSASLTSTPVVYFGDFVYESATPLCAGLSPGSVGLYQVNVTIPPRRTQRQRGCDDSVRRLHQQHCANRGTVA
jgi:uncharacterized protein (TIGR03437 family)